MSKKSHSFDVLSDRECVKPGCSKKIKQRLVNDIDAHRCYKHNLEFKKSKHKAANR